MEFAKSSLLSMASVTKASPQHFVMLCGLPTIALQGTLKKNPGIEKVSGLGEAWHIDILITPQKDFMGFTSPTEALMGALSRPCTLGVVGLVEIVR